ncbi:MAG: hypothetical protein D6799_05500 [Bacteroidetes bacterium]|nr:MAG: hypothetical protein D6799_05500 [Bacteroidota bacterium]
MGKHHTNTEDSPQSRYYQAFAGGGKISFHTIKFYTTNVRSIFQLKKFFMLFFVKLDEILRNFFILRPVFNCASSILKCNKNSSKEFRPRRTKSAKK